MVKRHWFRGLYIGTIIGLVITLIDVFLGVFKVSVPIYVNFPSFYTINIIFHLTDITQRIIAGSLANILTYGIIGLLIGLIFKKK